MLKNKFIILLFYFICLSVPSFSQTETETEDLTDSARKAHDYLKGAQVNSLLKEIKILIRDVDITSFPDIKVIVEAFNVYGEPLDSLDPDKVLIYESGIEKPIIKIDKISVRERVPVDFVFLIDVTASMQNYIDAVKENIIRFTSSLVRRGIDYKIGLVLFSDRIEKLYDPINDVYRFQRWLSDVKASGGGDVKENALDALSEATKLEFRSGANTVGVLITDAPYHQTGESGDGKTTFNTESIIKILVNNEFRLFSIVPPKLVDYSLISEATRGIVFDIDYPFSTILDIFSNQLTNLFAITYRSQFKAIPDSIDIALLNKTKNRLIKKTIPIIELGRKLIIENLLYKTGSYDLPDSVPELEIMLQFMKSRTKVSILVEGHTDNIGSNRLNDNLSLQRAESVKRYLVKKGILSSRIKTVGFGKRKPLASNDTEFGRQLNRRTEIVIIAK
ncbi:MAG: hypothetical protein QG635_128 [Bacteroidota bacterium]|nr:hypothetical protein [Bacteroidota bacterium]